MHGYIFIVYLFDIVDVNIFSYKLVKVRQVWFRTKLKWYVNWTYGVLVCDAHIYIVNMLETKGTISSNQAIEYTRIGNMHDEAPTQTKYWIEVIVQISCMAWRK